MKNYRTNSLMAGVLYFLGTVFGVLSTVLGGEVISSLVGSSPLSSSALLSLVTTDPSPLIGGSFCILLMGISLVAMTVFLYPVFRKDSRELAVGLLLFRGALEGTWYILTTLGVLVLFVLGREYGASGADSSSLASLIHVAYQVQDRLAPMGPLFFLTGATCLYISFFRTKLIPRWLSVWGLVGVVPYLGYALLHYFQMDNGIGLYLQMILAPQEIVMALWLMIRGFDPGALKVMLEKSAVRA